MSNTPRQAVGTVDDGEEDDYMNMVFADAPPAPETSFQRRSRLRREGEQRGRIKSKAELAEEEAFKRETALATSLLDKATGESGARKSKGLAMMAKMGFKPGSALGPVEQARGSGGGDAGADGGRGGGSTAGEESSHPDTRLREPLRISVREDRGGIGLGSERKRKVREAAEALAGGAKRAKAEEGEFRDRVRRTREVARLERQLHAAQKLAERMSEEEENEKENEEDGTGGGLLPVADDNDETKRRAGHAKPPSSTTTTARNPLKSINVLWRGLARAREAAEQERKARHELQSTINLSSLPRVQGGGGGGGGQRLVLPTYDDADEDADDRTAMGKDLAPIHDVAAEEGEEGKEGEGPEDPELEEFESRDVEDRLRSVLAYLRERHNYCFWCKFRYPDREMEGCPGLLEDDHD